MRIAFVLHTAYPEFIGGREHHIHNLATAFSATDEVIVIAGSKTRVIERYKINNYTLVRIPMVSIRVSKNPLQLYRIIPGLFSALKKEKFDLIHASEYGSYSTDIAHIYSKRYNIPLVLTVYGYQFKNPLLKIFKKFYDYSIGRSLLRSAKKIFCVSDVQRREILKIAGDKTIEEKVIAQINCIPTNNYKALAIKNNLLNRYDLINKINLLTIARLLPRKGIINLIFALEIVIRKYHFEDVKLIIIGPDCGELKNIRNTIKKLGLENNIIIVGPVPYEQVKDFLAVSDIFVLPSLYEGLPLALLEAMAAGKAVIFSNLTCAKEVITDSQDGLLVEPGDINSLVKAMLKLLNDKMLRDTLGINAKRKVERFDSQIEMERTKKIYEQILRIHDKY